MAERRSIGWWTRLTREFQRSCRLAGARISRRKLPQQQQQRSQQNIRSFQHDPVCLHAPIILIKRNKQVLGSRFWNRFLDQTVPVPEYSSTRHSSKKCIRHNKVILTLTIYILIYNHIIYTIYILICNHIIYTIYILIYNHIIYTIYI